jgi:hypothetical protein
MGRRNAAALTVALLSALSTGCLPFDSVDGSFEPLADAVRESARTSKAFRLSATTDFDWDRVYVFPQYSTPEAIESELGFEWGEAGDSEVRSTDSVHLIVFVEDGEVVRAFDQDTGDGYFICVGRPVVKGGLSQREAVLKAIQTPEGGSLRYVSLARPRSAREAARTKKCLETYT